MGNILPECADISFPDAVVRQLADNMERGAGYAVLDQSGHSKGLGSPVDVHGPGQVNIDLLSVEIIAAFRTIIYGKEQRVNSTSGQPLQKLLVSATDVGVIHSLPV